MESSRDETAIKVFTIGHSTRSLEAFIGLLRINAVQQVVDIRTIPRSRHNPQFNKEVLPANLAASDIRYTHMPGLGGLRHVRADSPNKGWHNASFQGFADYMQTREFDENLGRLMELIPVQMVALMCAEAMPWRCHRSLIADALAVRQITVGHIIDPRNVRMHTITSWARVSGTSVTYPP